MMEMSREAERENSSGKGQSAKTEVPTRVHWVKRTFLILLPTFTHTLLNSVMKLALPTFILPSVPSWGKLLILPC